MEFGIRFHRVVFDHLLQFQYNSFGLSSSLFALSLNASLLFCSFVRYCGQRSSLLRSSVLGPHCGPVRQPGERRGIGRCVLVCVCMTCRVEEGYIGSEQLVGYLQRALSSHGLLSGLALTGASHQPCLSASATPARLTTFTLLIKVSAMVTDYRGHCRTLFFLPRIISLFTMCVGYI